MAKMNMHEKSFVIDSDKLINSSANMSSGAKTRYSEDFVFIDSDGETENDLLISAFEKEFAILWNSADDIVSEGELQKADKLDYQIEVKNEPMTDTNMTLISSSMNFNYSKTKITSADYKKGRSLKMRLKKDLDENTYIIAKELIKAIDNAQSNILMSVNHFNLYSVSQALIRAVERGVDVKLYVDNQEFKTRIRDEGRKSIEMTPRFVRDYKKLKNDKNAKAPVRVKFYSHAPHHSSWFLNHHKYILIDYNSKDLKNTVLFSGSYNISKNAETKQFDNLVKFESSSYASLFTAYYENFMTNWNFNRTEKDKPKNEILSKYTQVHNENSVYIHAKKPSDSISLTWDEAIKLKKDIGKVAPGFFRGLFQNKGCYGYNIETKKYFGCR
jgi:phosphatidylserine/phosphatidylglycerophosphate/cardiolipin synthase-like enzyme